MRTTTRNVFLPSIAFMTVFALGAAVFSITGLSTPAMAQEVTLDHILDAAPDSPIFSDTQSTAQQDVMPPQPLPALYSPDYCEFEARFPEEPFIKQMCDGGESGTECYDQVSYTHTFALDATISIRVICNKIGEDIKDKYDEDVMVKTLEAMTSGEVTQTFSTSYTEDEEGRYRLAGLIGEGQVGLMPSMFIAQMWLGKNSAFTVEAELIGEQFPESDGLFRDILRSIRYSEDSVSENARDPDHESTHGQNNEADREKAENPAENNE